MGNGRKNNGQPTSNTIKELSIASVGDLHHEFSEMRIIWSPQKKKKKGKNKDLDFEISN